MKRLINPHRDKTIGTSTMNDLSSIEHGGMRPFSNMWEFFIKTIVWNFYEVFR